MTVKTDIWMPLYIADYLKDTGRLNTVGHGAYFLLIMDYWVNGAPSDDDEDLATITRLGLKEWKALRPKLDKFFEIRNGKWHHKRIDEEKDKANGITNKRSKAGAAGAKKRWETDSKDDGKQIANGIANASQTIWQNDAQSQSQPPNPGLNKDYLNHLPPLSGSASDGGGSPEPEKTQGPSRSGSIAMLLRSRGLKTGSTAAEVIDWARENISDEILLEALEEAKRTLGKSPGSSAYLAPIVERLLNPNPQGVSHAKPRKYNPAEAALAELEQADRLRRNSEPVDGEIHEPVRGEVYEHGQH